MAAEISIFYHCLPQLLVFIRRKASLKEGHSYQVTGSWPKFPGMHLAGCCTSMGVYHHSEGREKGKSGKRIGFPAWKISFFPLPHQHPSVFLHEQHGVEKKEQKRSFALSCSCLTSLTLLHSSHKCKSEYSFWDPNPKTRS